MDFLHSSHQPLYQEYHIYYQYHLYLMYPFTANAIDTLSTDPPDTCPRYQKYDLYPL